MRRRYEGVFWKDNNASTKQDLVATQYVKVLMQHLMPYSVDLLKLNTNRFHRVVRLMLV